MDQMIALVVVMAFVVLAALGGIVGADSRDYEPRDAMGGYR